MSASERGGATVTLRDVRVRYPGADRDAVDGVSLDVAAGELLVFLGPSGCGKSTLLRTVNRLVVPREGTIEVDGNDVAASAPETLRRGIGYVIQAVGLFPHLTVAKNVAVVPELLGWNATDVRTRVDELLELVRLDPKRYRDRLPRELSGGEQQRVGVARAIAGRPRVLLMDEPFGAVDAIVRKALQQSVRDIHRELDTTILFVTHDVDEALALADRVVVMNAGKIEAADTPLGLLVEPQTDYAAELLDAGDAVRRLSLLCAGDALGDERSDGDTGDTGDAKLDAGATLREALSLLLEGAPAVAIERDGRPAGTLRYDDIRRAIGERRDAA